MLLRPLARRLPTRRAAAACGRRRGVATQAPDTLAEAVIGAVHSATGAPWWAAIAGSAVALRIGLLPLVRFQVLESRRFGALRPVLAAMRAECAAIHPPSARALATLRGIRRCCDDAGVRLGALAGATLLPIPLLVVAVVSMRRALEVDAPLAPALRNGGLGFFRDLTAPDPTRLLPIASLLLLIANLQLLGRGSAPGGLLSILRNWMQAIALVTFPFYVQLPAGVFMYWLPNSAFSLCQGAVIRATMPRAAAAAAAARRLKAPGALPTSGTASAAAGEPSAGSASSVRAVPASSVKWAEISPAVDAARPDAQEKREAVRGGEGGDEGNGVPIGADSLDVGATVDLSKQLLREKRTDAAVHLLWRALRRTPPAESAPLRFQLGLALSLQGQHEAAEALFKQVLELEPSFAEASLCLATCQQAQGKLTEAVATLRAVGESRPDLAAWCRAQVDRMGVEPEGERGAERGEAQDLVKDPTAEGASASTTAATSDAAPSTPPTAQRLGSGQRDGPTGRRQFSTAATLRPLRFDVAGGAALKLHELGGSHGPQRTGGKTWDSAFVLAAWLAEHASDVRGRRVIELGSGTGLAGLSAAALGASATLTDEHPDVLALHATNIDANAATLADAGGRARSRRLRWGCASDIAGALGGGGRYDLCLGSDVVFFPGMHAELLGTMRALAARTLLAYPLRPAEESIVDSAIAAGMRAQEVARRRSSAARMVSIIEVVAPEPPGGGGIEYYG